MRIIGMVQPPDHAHQMRNRIRCTTRQGVPQVQAPTHGGRGYSSMAEDSEVFVPSGDMICGFQALNLDITLREL